MTESDARRQAGSALPWLLLFLLVAALVGSLVKGCWDRDNAVRILGSAVA